MIPGDVPLIVCVTMDAEVRERIARSVADFGVVIMCTDVAELRVIFGHPDQPGNISAGGGNGIASGSSNGNGNAAAGNSGGNGAGSGSGSGNRGGNGAVAGNSGGNGAGSGNGGGGNGGHWASRNGTVQFGSLRVGAMARRAARAVHEAAQTVPISVVSVGELLIDGESHIASWRGHTMPLTRLEWELLGSLASPPPAVWTYERLFSAVWGGAYLGDTSILHSAMKRLRRKLRDAGEGVAVETVRGVGYRLAVTG